MDPSWLAGRGAPQPPARPDIPTPGDTPDRMPSLRGQRPSLTAITMKGLDQPTGGQFGFTFADGFQATETLPELAHMGLDPKVISAVNEVFVHLGDLVYATNHGGGGPAR